jgi:hypothetical protein
LDVEVIGRVEENAVDRKKRDPITEISRCGSWGRFTNGIYGIIRIVHKTSV